MCVRVCTQVFYKELAHVYGAWQTQIYTVGQQVPGPGEPVVQIKVQRQRVGEFSLAQAGWSFFIFIFFLFSLN